MCVDVYQLPFVTLTCAFEKNKSPLSVVSDCFKTLYFGSTVFWLLAILCWYEVFDDLGESLSVGLKNTFTEALTWCAAQTDLGEPPQKNLCC